MSQQYDPREPQRQVRRPGTSGRVHSLGNSGRKSSDASGTAGRRSSPVAGDASRRRASSRPGPAQAGYYEMHEYDTEAPTSRQAARSPRQVAREARARRRAQRRMLLMVTVASIFLLAGVLTLILPKDKVASTADFATPEAAITSAIAPLPYAAATAIADGGATEDGSADIWGAVGPVRQTENFVYTATPADTPVLPAMGNVDLSWFGDAAFLGDSITEGFSEYGIDAGGALICGYVGASPNQVVNRTVLTHPERGDEIALDKLAQAQPRKVYILMGTNALVGTGNDESFVAYYGQMLDDLRATLPEAAIYVQSVLTVRPEALEKAPGLATDRLASINGALLSLCAEKGCYYVDLNSVFDDDTGALSSDYAESDGIHLRKRAYSVWLEDLSSRVPYSKDNPYREGSTYYLSDTMKSLLSDLP